ncbi:MAG: sigma-70 family RNA polymerase sigma factor [Thermoleophilaceae bacterium]|nr:sigma-70 family RNA polymerase sigma factor [Thermoleophilaceae bacterium]
MVAVTLKRLGEALAALDPESRALLDLNVRRGMEENEIAEILNVDADNVASRRRKILEGLDSELGLETREDRDELRATLPDLPPKLWQGR